MPPKQRAISSAERARLSPRERNRRKRIAHEKMALRLEDEEVYHLVKRIRLTTADLNRIFNADVWYIKDEASGDVFWPEQWQQELQPHTERNPWKYFMVRSLSWPFLSASIAAFWTVRCALLVFMA